MKSKLFNALKITLLVTGLGCVASVTWAGYQYLHTDPRYSLKLVTVRDLKRLEAEDILARIQLNTEGSTNIFAVDLDDVRARVEQMEWVHHATVQRVLPDQIVIRVVERVPIGVARIHGRMYEFDAEAAILDPDQSPLLELPVLVELSEKDTESNLRKIGMYNKTIADLGSEGILQILVDSSNEVSIVRNEDPLIVKLGVVDFKERWGRYLALKASNGSEFEGAVRVDLRFRNEVIVSTQDEDNGKVIWDGKKKSL